MRLRTAPVAVLLAAAALVSARPDVVRAGDPPAAKPAGNFAQQFVANLRLGVGLQSSQVILFPLWVEGKLAEPDAQPSAAGSVVTFAEPEHPKKRDNLDVFNARTSPVYVAGGTVVEGGKRDRMIPIDHVILAGKTVELETLPASTAKGVRKEPKKFRTILPLAPPYLRAEAETSTARSIVPRFVSHFLEFRDDGDLRESLVAIAETQKLAEFCLVCQRSMDKWPTAIQEGTVVGGIAVVRGRVQALEVFGSNALLRAYFEPILRSLAFPAAAVEIRAEKAGIPIPGKDDPTKTLEKATAAANELFAKLKAASYAADKTAEGESPDAQHLTLGERIRGRAVGSNGQLVHLSVFPHDPFEYGLYSQPLNPLLPEDIASDPERMGLMEMERRDEMGARLTEAERRLLERLRGGLGGGVGGGGLGPK